MARNFKNESELRKKKYKRLVADIEFSYGNKFIEKLQSEKITFSEWLKKIIDEYMKK